MFSTRENETHPTEWKRRVGKRRICCCGRNRRRESSCGKVMAEERAVGEKRAVWESRGHTVDGDGYKSTELEKL